MGGCRSAASGPEVILLDSASYAAAFDLAVEAAREHGMPTVLRDRRNGVIETQSNIAGSALEPWRTDNASLDQAVENTLAYRRRRARFEFTPVAFQGPSGTPAGEMRGPDLLAAAPSDAVDLSAFQGEIELRVWVFVEQAQFPGVRRSTWSRSLTTTARAVDADEGARRETTSRWTPVTRDAAYEERLLGQISRQLQ
jgi:hypothetical protein